MPWWSSAAGTRTTRGNWPGWRKPHGLPVALIQTAADLDPVWLNQFNVVGLTAGTSTLESTIDEVEAAMRRLAATRPPVGIAPPTVLPFNRFLPGGPAACG